MLRTIAPVTRIADAARAGPINARIDIAALHAVAVVGVSWTVRAAVTKRRRVALIGTTAAERSDGYHRIARAIRTVSGASLGDIAVAHGRPTRGPAADEAIGGTVEPTCAVFRHIAHVDRSTTQPIIRYSAITRAGRGAAGAVLRHIAGTVRPTAKLARSTEWICRTTIVGTIARRSLVAFGGRSSAHRARTMFGVAGTAVAHAIADLLRVAVALRATTHSGATVFAVRPAIR